MKNWTDSIIKDWRSKKINLNSAATLYEIAEVERILQFHLPEDFKELYIKIDGYFDWDWTPNMFSLWPLNRILEEYKNEDSKDSVIVADWLINAIQYGFCKNASGIYNVYYPQLIADSYSEFIQLIQLDSIKLY